MTILANSNSRTLLGIDTYERAIVYSALLLRASNNLLNKENKYYNAIRIAATQNKITIDEEIIAKGFLIIEAKLPYTSSYALKSAGDFLSYIMPFSSLDPNPLIVTSSPSEGTPTPPEPPNVVVSLEQFFVWSCLELQRTILPNLDILTITFLEEDPTEPSLQISLRLPYSYQVYLESRNFIQAVDKIGSPSNGGGGNGNGGNGNGGNGGNGTLLIGNNSSLGNNSLIGN